MIVDYLDFWLNDKNKGFEFIQRKILIDQIIYEGKFLIKNNYVGIKNFREKVAFDRKLEKGLNRKIKKLNDELEKEIESNLRFSIDGTSSNP